MTADVHPLSASLRGGESGTSYEILGKLATGGMAELFLARAPSPTGRPGPVVVLKRILPHLAEDPEFIRMFRDEAYLAATLRHPNIVQVFDIGKQGEDYFFTMEYVHGENLRAILRAAQKRGESIPLTHILTVALGITAALHHAHEQKDDQGRPLHIVHRDVSPTNVLVAYDGSVKIVDFGIAKAAAGTHVTQAGMLKGKASYMSPEQCRASHVDRRSDVFAIGILLYEMTTLTRLFKGENELAILHQVLSGAADPPSQRRPGYPPELERIVMRALASNPDDRYPTAEALQADLMRFGQSNGIRPSHPALGQFLRGLLGNKPLPWNDEPAPSKPQAVPANAAQPPPQPRPPAQPRAAQPPKPSGRPPAPQPRPARGPGSRGPGSRGPAAKAWRPGGGRKAPPAAPASPKQPDPTTAKQLRLGQQAPARAPQPSHAASRPTAPRSATVPKPPSRSAPRPPARSAAPPKPAAPARPAAPPRPAAQPRPAGPPPKPAPAAAYAPPPPDYDIDPEESKTAIAPGRSSGYDAMQEAKTRVSGTTADDVAAFVAAAPAAQLSGDDAATQVAHKTADDVAAFLAAAPPADLVGDEPSPMVVKTQIAPATAEEIRALADAAAKAKAERDLFSAPAAPTRPGGKPEQQQQQQQQQQQAPAAPPTPRPSIPAPSDLPPPGGARPAVPPPSSLPPPGGAPQGQSPPANRRDTIMNAPAQPAALGGPSRTAPPSSGPGGASEMDEMATQRMSVDRALEQRPVQAPAAPARPAPQPGQPAQGQHPYPVAQPHNTNQTVPMDANVAAGMPAQQQHPPQASPPGPSLGSPLGPPQAPIHHWQAAVPQQQDFPQGHTMPMPMADLEDEPLVVPGRNTKVIAMVVTVIVGLTVGAAGVFFFLLD
ncbi:MAG: protein kinase domain-containing protein [Nannocystaceae bacterium]